MTIFVVLCLQELALFCRMYCSFVIARCCKEEMRSANDSISSLLSFVMLDLEGGAFGMWIRLIDR